MQKLDDSLKWENILDVFPWRLFGYLNRIEKQVGDIDKIELPRGVEKRDNFLIFYQGVFYGLISLNLLTYFNSFNLS